MVIGIERDGRCGADRLTLRPDTSRRVLALPIRAIGATPRVAPTCRSPTVPTRSAHGLGSACPAGPKTAWLREQVLVTHEGRSSPDCSRGMNGLFSVSALLHA